LQFANAGVDASRIAFQPWMALGDYLALHLQIDLALDPFPYNGGTTSYHSLWMGVPFVTLAGDRSVSRCGATILASVGLDDWVAHCEEAYVAKVLGALNDLPRLNDLRLSLRSRVVGADANRSALFAAALEGEYRRMWRDWCSHHTGP
jgi:predicted O-linked N-acetylglucosamine transferase (SPINDLY family)